jgi:hypothetical protein
VRSQSAAFPGLRSEVFGNPQVCHDTAKSIRPPHPG